MLGHEEAVPLLEETLREEKEADKKLTGIAEHTVNVQATERNGEPARRGAPRGGRMAAAEDESENEEDEKEEE